MEHTNFDFIGAVVDFNKQVLGVAPRELNLLPLNEHLHACKCLNEELTEYCEAYSEGKFVDSVDALVDLLYFGIGALYKMGLTAGQIKDACHIVHEANMLKKFGAVDKRYNGAPDAVKPAGWTRPEAKIAQALGVALCN